MTIEIDQSSGFCFGVTRAIGKAEEELQSGQRLYCLGDIVHNGRECDRLKSLGLDTIGHDELQHLYDAKVLFRAHGEPPSTYETAKTHRINLIDATCPVVLQLQRRIKREYDTPSEHQKQIVIFGKNGHAEVLGLVGQTDGTAIVVESLEDVKHLDFTKDIRLYSQTTKSIDDFRRIVAYIEQNIQAPATFQSFDTICRQVANRMTGIREFAASHDHIFFVSGHKSSNGRVLFAQCQSVNKRSYLIDSAEEITPDMLVDAQNIGICGATSTPRWLMEQCKVRIQQLLGSGE